MPSPLFATQRLAPSNAIPLGFVPTGKTLPGVAQLPEELLFALPLLLLPPSVPLLTVLPPLVLPPNVVLAALLPPPVLPPNVTLLAVAPLLVLLPGPMLLELLLRLMLALPVELWLVVVPPVELPLMAPLLVVVVGALQLTAQFQAPFVQTGPQTQSAAQEPQPGISPAQPLPLPLVAAA